MVKFIFFSISFFLTLLGAKSTMPAKATFHKSRQPIIMAARIKMMDRIKMGAEDTPQYLYLLKGKRIALLVNQTSVFYNRTTLVDSLHRLGIDIKKIFAPEHGFRGNEDAGATVTNQIDKKTGIPVVSLYGNKLKPSKSDLSNVDIVIFDIQDVGARFYTFISTMYYMMEACAENNKALIILDRPNPNGYYVDGPLLEPKYKSFVGIIPIPIVHGCTVGELARMINGEGWLDSARTCQLTVVHCRYYSHRRLYSLPIKPSPNLVNDRSIELYPSLCLFEGTEVSVGRGTDYPFQVIGSPYAMVLKLFSFIPTSKVGATNPPFKDQKCFGIDLQMNPDYTWVPEGKLQLRYLLQMYQAFGANQSKFFHADNFFNKLAGNDELQAQIKAGLTEDEIRATWQDGLQHYKEIRRKYLIYGDFE